MTAETYCNLSPVSVLLANPNLQKVKQKLNIEIDERTNCFFGNETAAKNTTKTVKLAVRE